MPVLPTQQQRQPVTLPISQRWPASHHLPNRVPLRLIIFRRAPTTEPPTLTNR